MRTPCWIWQFNTDYPPAGSSFTHQGKSIPLIGPDDSKAPISEAYVKTHDGLYWMSGLYTHPLAPSSTNLQTIQGIYHNQGIMFTPWCVPKGLQPILEAKMANQVLSITGRLILDVEPYQWFWEGPFSNLHPYMQYIRDRYPDAWIGLSFDPRYGQYGQYNVDKYRDIHFEEWLPYVDALLPQDYWETFGVNASWEIEHTTARIAETGKEIIHAIPGHAPLGSFGEAVRRILGNGNRFSIWRRGTYATYNAEYVSEALGLGPPTDSCADLVAEVKKLQGLLQQSEDESGRRLRCIKNYESLLQAGAASLEGTANAFRRDIPYTPG